MKKTLFIFSFGFSLVFFSIVSASAFNLSCELDQWQKVDVFLDAELMLKDYPTLQYLENSRQWALHVGRMTLDSANSQSQDLRKRRLKQSKNKTLITFWIRGVRWYDLEVDPIMKSVSLYWWGTVKRSFVASFHCS